MKRLLSIVLSSVVLFEMFTFYSYAESNNKFIDNSSLLPKITDDSNVKLEQLGQLYTPDWFKSVIMAEIVIKSATPEGTFQSAVSLLDHYAETGVNCLWISSFHEEGPEGNGYSNKGIHTVEPKLTGTDDVNESWNIIKNFVDEAHKRNIRILFDVVTWGTAKNADLVNEHPEFYSGKEEWGNLGFNWESEELRSWFVENAVQNILRTGADGYRCDCEPNYSGYDVFAKVKQELREKGKYIVVIAEDGNKRKNVYESEMDSVLDYSLVSRAEQYQNPINFYIDDLNIVDSIKFGKGIGSESLQKNLLGGMYQYNTFCLSNHDYWKRAVDGNRLVIGYQALFAPFIPYWFMGDEIGMSYDGTQKPHSQWLYSQAFDMSVVENPVNRQFFEDVKQYIKIRRTYSDIFEYFPSSVRNANICKVKTDGITALQAYARFTDKKAIIIVPNNEKNTDGYFTAKIPYNAMGFDNSLEITVTDLMTGKEVVKGNRNELKSFDGQVKYEHIGIYLVTAKENNNGNFIVKLFKQIKDFFIKILELLNIK